ncbi:MAG: HEAT repeat domain-containing protein [Myxococcales bacterium]|nr:HEAT repeat domain-containing protein [Myxococcales bacterium]MCB9575800.1 HEAT repeat domain-containing protein [Polyangiaceae bacterium]
MKVEEIEQGLLSEDPELRRRAAAALANEAGPKSVALLMRALGDEDWRVRKEATSAAVALRPSRAVLDALCSAFEPGQNVGLRNAAVEAIAGYGEVAVEALGNALATLDADGRKLAVEALAKTGRPRALRYLEATLGDDDPNVRAAAMEAVSQIASTCSTQAIVVLDRGLDSADALQRLAALEGLNNLAVTMPWHRIEPLLSDPVLERAALVAAGSSADPRAAAVLVSALDAAPRRAFGEVLAGIADLGRGEGALKRAIRESADRLSAGSVDRVLAFASGDAGPELRRLALLPAALLAGSRAAEVVLDALADDTVALEAEEALEALGADVAPELVRRATYGEASERAAYLELIGELASEQASADVVSVVRAALRDANVEVACAALSAAAALGDASTLPLVARWLNPSEPVAARKLAEGALARLSERHPDVAREFAAAAGPESAAAVATIIANGTAPVFGTAEKDVEYLSSLLSHEQAPLRRVALDALATLPSPLGVEAVAFALSDEEPEVRLAAVRALGRLGGAVATQRLFDLVDDAEEPELSAAAIRALGETGDVRAIGVLRDIARSADGLAAVAAVDALSRTGDPRRIDALIDASSHPDSEVVKSALRGLALERDPRAVAHLGACLDHDAWDVRRLAADLLGRIGDGSAMGLLRAKLSTEGEPLVREAVARALELLEAGGGLRRTTPPPPLGPPK